MASGTVNMFRQLGGVLGTSVLGSILTSQIAAAALTESPAKAFESAFHLCAVVAAVVFAVVAIPTALFVHSRPAH
jgi:DHA2 family multidrug resistance protein-like MFS transporter